MMMPSIFGENLLDAFMDDFSFPVFSDMEKTLYGKHSKGLMKTDVKETDSGYEVEMDLPGFRKEEVKASLENGYLTIHASKEVNQDAQEDSGKYIRKERYTGTCERSFYVGENITENDIRGEFKDGSLKLFIPKKEAKPVVEQKKYIAIEG